jgi:hypothetical protein
VYWYMNQQHYPDGARERDSILGKLRQLKMVSPELHADVVSSGRNLLRKLAELSDEEFSSLVQIFGDACGS